MDKLKECLRCKSPDIAIKKMFGGIHGIFCPKCGTLVSIAGCESLEDAIAAWNTRTAPANPPLTPDELREMDGEPVWCVDDGRGNLPDLTGWYLVDAVSEGLISVKGICVGFAKFDGRCGIYRHKPEREETTLGLFS